ncbi:FadR family transcriptional regulator OS=Streptomyces alboniger OX=132473 GN=CP975_12785 PE=4 SV=1 [Streptomyces alboniger]
MSAAGIRRPQRTTTTEQAYQSILAAILDGTIPADAPLRLQDLSQSLGMSMMPIREAIRQLEAIGVVEIEPHRGARVRAVSADDLEDTYLTRITLEGILVRRAAARFDTAAEEEARKALDDQQKALETGDAAAAREAHERFHHGIYRAAGSMWLFRSIAPTWHNSERYRASSTADAQIVLSRRKDHEQILQACVDGQPEKAQEALQQHLLATVAALDPEVAQRLARAVGADS